MRRSSRAGDIHQKTGKAEVVIAVSGDQNNITVMAGESVSTVDLASPGHQRGIPAPAVVGHSLPRVTSAFTGRDDELRVLLDAVGQGLRTGHPTLIAVDGMAGVGKTTLAAAAFDRLKSRFPDGVWVLRLHGHDSDWEPVDPETALWALLREVGVEPGDIPAGLTARAQKWRDLTAPRHFLLLLDDAANYHQVAPLDPGAGGCATLITSRRRLTALTQAEPISLDVLSDDDAAQLLQHLSGRQQSHVDAVRGLVRQAGNLPLAIELLSGWLRHHPARSIQDLADELKKARDRSAAIGAVDAPVSATFDLSFNNLPAAQQELFRFLGLHPGIDFDGYAVAALTGLELGPVSADLDALYTDHLIEEPSAGRYRFHALLGDYARALAMARPDRNDRRRLNQLLRYYWHGAINAGAQISFGLLATPDPPRVSIPAESPPLAERNQAVSWLEAEQPNLIAMVDFAIRNSRDREAVQIAAATHNFLLRRGDWDQARKLQERTLAVARSNHNRSAQAAILHRLAFVQRLAGQNHLASTNLQQAQQLLRYSRNKRAKATVLSELGMIQRSCGEHENAIASQSCAVRLYSEAGDGRGAGSALSELAMSQIAIDDVEGAFASMERAARLFREAEHKVGEMTQRASLAVFYFEIGDIGAAMASAAEAVRLLAELSGGRVDAGEMTGIFAETSGGEQDMTALTAALASLSDRMLQMTRDPASDFNSPTAEGLALEFNGEQREQAGDYSAAAEAWEGAARLYRRLEDQKGMARALINLDRLRLVLGTPSAGQASAAALDLYGELDDQFGQALALNQMGGALYAAAQFSDAGSHFERALDIARTIHDPLVEAHALEGIGKCKVQEQHMDEGTAYLRDALAIYERVSSPDAERVREALDAP